MATESRAVPRLRDLSIADLDGDLPIFPLPGALLLPHGRLPLNIFEPRYLAMIDDALRSRRLIGMIQPQGVEADNDDAENDDGEEESLEQKFGIAPPANAAASRMSSSALYQIGCAGRLISFVEREDGTYSVTLAGIARFRVHHEIDSLHGYRRIVPDFAMFNDDLDDPRPAAFNRDALIDALRRFFAARGFEARWEAIEQMDDETLVITLSMICPFAVAEKQALLEAHTLQQRAHTLLALLEMAGHETEDGHRPHAV